MEPAYQAAPIRERASTMVTTRKATWVPIFDSDNAACDHSLLQALREGDELAGEAVYERFKHPVHAALRARIRSPQLREDALQEVFLRTFAYFRGGRTLEKPGSLPAFLLAVARNTAREVLRKNTREMQFFEAIHDRIDHSANLESDFLQQERKSILYRVMMTLKSSDRVLIQRAYMLVQDQSTICRELQMHQ